ncbi:putative methyltransferase [Gracilariopsis chorda]|uniref:Putative methyltransferase n=1 Tax=Gracilariopsis chorda TaxID=448386 RepID=A0A2V3IH04_9FLOR|nr:putative methyltransferase [Gracilariopsis chorda]|eukprot:PXF41386.1 putative methyltransferase [Gracilariopsis chorda]
MPAQPPSNPTPPLPSPRTVSIALPSSILLNAQSSELRIYLAGQIARAAAIYKVHELVIFDEQVAQPSRRAKLPDNPSAFFKLVLDYLETPQYLRKHLFPVSPHLRLVGLLNPLALPTHVARTDVVRWRDGVALNRTHQRVHASSSPPTRYVDVGLSRLVELDTPVPPGTRVTVDMEPSGHDYDAVPGKYLFGKLASPHQRAAEQLYCGYQVRTAKCLSQVFTNSLVCDNYDLVIGTSERGTPINNFQHTSALSNFKNLLLVFGGVQGLEHSVIGDTQLEQLNISPTASLPSQHQAEQNHNNVADLFDFYINTCPDQGSRTIRTEEAVLISLAALQPFINPTSNT